MMLLTPAGNYDDREQAAMSIAANRLSKIRLLLSDGLPRCDEIARGYAERLNDDISAQIRRHPRMSALTVLYLQDVARFALNETREES